jgi:hypothetical protein
MPLRRKIGGCGTFLNLCPRPGKQGCAILSDVMQLKSWLEKSCAIIMP